MDHHRVFVQIAGDFAVPLPTGWFQVCRRLARDGPPELAEVVVTASAPEGVATLGPGAKVAGADEAEAVRIASFALWRAIGGAGLLPSGAVLDL